jgi:hypothetical protein
MEEELARNLVGQDEAIAVISKCIRLSRAGLRYHDRPLGVFLMVGPTVSFPLLLLHFRAACGPVISAVFRVEPPLFCCSFLF